MKEEKMKIFESNLKIGSKSNKPKKWQYLMMFIFIIPSLLFLVIGTFLLRLADLLMFDTHHFNISVTAKE